MAGRLVTDELWAEIDSLFPRFEPSSKGGWPPVINRSVFTCVVFMLKTGIGYRHLPTELGASQKTVRRRLKSWAEIGLWEEIFEQLLTKLRRAGRLDLAEVLIDGGLAKAPCGGEKSARTQWIEVVTVHGPVRETDLDMNRGVLAQCPHERLQEPYRTAAGS